MDQSCPHRLVFCCTVHTTGCSNPAPPHKNLTKELTYLQHACACTQVQYIHTSSYVIQLTFHLLYVCMCVNIYLVHTYHTCIFCSYIQYMHILILTHHFVMNLHFCFIHLCFMYFHLNVLSLFNPIKTHKYIKYKHILTGASSAVVSTPALVPEVLGSNPVSSPTHEACLRSLPVWRFE
jgi:hypothetical protein